MWDGKRCDAFGTRGLCRDAIDISAEAIDQARAKFGSHATFLAADMALPLPFPDGSFDAVMSNVALHMFPDVVTRSLFAEVGRVVRLRWPLPLSRECARGSPAARSPATSRRRAGAGLRTRADRPDHAFLLRRIPAPAPPGLARRPPRPG
ncbi:MAG: class I SAM-dependent methyltransferase [Actinobacteria bacterium]|nr:class I SAM-dependent methyltransferase [Actinomycetota bacterium]